MSAPAQAFPIKDGVPQVDVEPASDSITATAARPASSVTRLGNSPTGPYPFSLPGGTVTGSDCWSCEYNCCKRLPLESI